MIYVYKTSLMSKKDTQKLKTFLDLLLLRAAWNFDLEDCDKVLRVDSQIEYSAAIVRLLNENGFDCEELPD